MKYFIGNKLLPSEHYELATVEECLEYFKDIEEIEVDTETEGLDAHTKNIICMQLGTTDRQYVIDVNVHKISLFKPLLEDSTKLLIFQNAKFDVQFFMANNITIKRVYDTMLAEYILTAGDDNASRSLKTLCEKYCDIDLDKTQRGNINRDGLSDAVIVYSALDVAYLSIIKAKQLEEIKKWELENVLALENEVVLVFAEMEYHGVLIDVDIWSKVAKQTETNVSSLVEELDEITTNEPKLVKFVPKYVQGNLFGAVERRIQINWSSPAQKLKVLNALGIKVESVGDSELQKTKQAHILIPKLIEFSKQNKLSSSFGYGFLKFINSKTGRIHPSYKQIISTGRISASKPNVAQIPSKGELATIIRSAFIPRPGYKIVGGDYSGFELRIIAEFSQDPIWLDVFNNGGDLHSVLCASTFDIPIEDVKKPFPPKPDLKYRDVQKTVGFGLSYGMSKFKLSSTLQIPLEEADKIIKAFFKKVPKVDKFLATLRKLGTARGYIRTGAPYRRIRWFPQWEESMSESPRASLLKGDIERASMNSPIQGSNGDCIKVALCLVNNAIKNEGWDAKILLSIYDEIRCECIEYQAENFKVRLEELMIEAAQKIIKTIPIVAECTVSDCWTK